MKRRILKSLRNEGLTAKSGFDPHCGPHSNVTVLGDRYTSQIVINANTYSILGLGCHGHRDYRFVQESLCNRVKKVLDSLNLNYKFNHGDQFVITIEGGDNV